MFRAWGLAAVALAMASASLATPTGGQTPLGGLYGGTLEVAVKQTLSFSPTATAPDDTVSWRAMEAAYDGLARLNPQTGVPEPSLAESWTVNSTARTLNATLRMGVKWADGTNLTPADVVASYAQYGYAATAVGQDIRFNFGSGGGGGFLTSGLTLPVAWKAAGGLAYSGPFAFASAPPPSMGPWVLTANEFYHRGRPFLDGITFRWYGNFTMDVGGGRTLACDLVDKTVDYVTFFPDPSELTIPVDCPSAGPYTVSDLVGPTAPSHLFPPANTGFSLLFLGFNTGSTNATNDSALRKAVALAADKDAFTKTIITTSRLAHSPIPAAFTFWYNTSVLRWQANKTVPTGGTVAVFSPSQAIDVLNKAGYVDLPPQNGFLNNPQGQEFSLSFVIPSFTEDAKAATIGAGIANNLVDVGLNVQVVEEDPVNITGRINAGTFDVVLWRMEGSANPNFLSDLFYKSATFTGALNKWNYRNDTLNLLLDAQRNEVDLDRRAQLVKDVLGGVAWDLPILPLLFEDVAEVVNVCRDSEHCGDFQGYVDAPDGLLHYLTFTNAHVTQYGPVEVELTAVERSLRSGDNTTLILRVRGATRLGGALAPLPNIPVSLSTPDGTFYTNVTGADGTLQTTYTAAAVNTTTDVELQAEVRVPGYDPAVAAAFVTVAPKDKTLRVTVSAEQRNLKSGVGTTVRVIVNDPDGNPLANASVLVTVGPADLGGGVSPAGGITDASGTFLTAFQANVSTDATFQVKARASVQGFDEGEAFASVVVAGPPPPSGVIPVLDLVAVIVLIAVLAWVVLNFLAARAMGPLRPKTPETGPSKAEKK